MSQPIEVKVLYFAILREERGCSEEVVLTESATAAELYAELRERHGFTLPPSLIQVSINREYRELGSSLSLGDEVVFVPPVTGG